MYSLYDSKKHTLKVHKCPHFVTPWEFGTACSPTEIPSHYQRSVQLKGPSKDCIALSPRGRETRVAGEVREGEIEGNKEKLRQMSIVLVSQLRNEKENAISRGVFFSACKFLPIMHTTASSWSHTFVGEQVGHVQASLGRKSSGCVCVSGG